jgi:predicted ATPase with chaperone activity
MAVCINSAALNGIDALIIHIETRITPGVQYFIVRLPDESVKESLIRVESAICCADLNMPRQKIVISGSYEIVLCRNDIKLPSPFCDQEKAFIIQLDAAASMLKMKMRGLLIIQKVKDT